MTVPSGIFKSDTNEASMIVFGVGSVMGNAVVVEEAVPVAMEARLVTAEVVAEAVADAAVKDDVDDDAEETVAMISSGFDMM